MPNENKPVEKEEIINGDETIKINPEMESDNEQDSEQSDDLADQDSDDDTGGSSPPPEKGRG